MVFANLARSEGCAKKKTEFQSRNFSAWSDAR